MEKADVFRSRTGGGLRSWTCTLRGGCVLRWSVCCQVSDATTTSVENPHGAGQAATHQSQTQGFLPVMSLLQPLGMSFVCILARKNVSWV